MIIGLSGKAGAGKDTVGACLVQQHGFKQDAFARRLKDAANAIFGLSYDQLYGDLKEVVDPHWGAAPREILQKLGTECLRNGYDENVWVWALRRGLKEGGHYVITDVRFPNEADAIRTWGGVIWRVERPGACAHNGVAEHPSEIALDDYAFDYKLANNASIEELYRNVRAAFEYTKGKAA